MQDLYLINIITVPEHYYRLVHEDRNGNFRLFNYCINPGTSPTKLCKRFVWRLGLRRQCA